MLPGLVALLAEGVDRNIQGAAIDCTGGRVALLAEGVDRNLFQMSINIGGDLVALLAEGVDRNTEVCEHRVVVTGRPPRGGRG